MIAYHFSHERLKIGDVITSHATKANSWPKYSKIYKEVADRLGIFFPTENIGWAYLWKPDRNFYEVEAPDEYISKGVNEFSIFVAMELGNRILPNCRAYPLDERKELVNRQIEKFAESYFKNEPSVHQLTEAISDRFTVIGKY